MTRLASVLGISEMHSLGFGFVRDSGLLPPPLPVSASFTHTHTHGLSHIAVFQHVPLPLVSEVVSISVSVSGKFKDLRYYSLEKYYILQYIIFSYTITIVILLLKLFTKLSINFPIFFQHLPLFPPTQPRP